MGCGSSKEDAGAAQPKQAPAGKPKAVEEHKGDTNDTVPEVKVEDTQEEASKATEESVSH